jgi:hypothetical protein
VGTDRARLAGELAARSYVALATLDELDRTKRTKRSTSRRLIRALARTPLGLTNIDHPQGRGQSNNTRMRHLNHIRI